ncbi:hypothetical protein Fmac_026166 [Flemingia macrophylla]|uniref:Uncharacterized protein n=1 Tax=Flemingia macrophylla TaxID=520843 RepID=A0ABD1LE50_9FABA
MSVLQFRAKLMVAVLITFLVMALEAPAILRSYVFGLGTGKALAESRKMNSGGESRFQRDSDKGEKLVNINISFRYRVRSLASNRRVPSPPPTPTRNRQKVQKITAKTFATPYSIPRHP